MSGTLWLMGQYDVPLCYVLERYRAAHEDARLLVWLETPPPDWDVGSAAGRRRPPEGTCERRFARQVPLRPGRDGREYPLTVTVVSPRLLAALWRAPEDVVIVQELNLVALFAVLTKLRRRRRRVVALIEGDLNFLGRTGRALPKLLLRRMVAAFVDVFAANSEEARRYLTQTLRARPERVLRGWWLAGLPTNGQAPAAAQQARGGDRPVFLAAGQLIRRKGFDLLLDAFARYRQAEGAGELRISGEGAEREALEEQARRLGVTDHVRFLGRLPHDRLEAALRSCDLLVFPTLYDLIGRVVVEALSVGTPVVTSCLSGAAGSLVRDGENGVIMDPRDPESLLGALRRGSDPDLLPALRARAQRGSGEFTPAAAAEVIWRAVSHARAGLEATSGSPR